MMLGKVHKAIIVGGGGACTGTFRVAPLMPGTAEVEHRANEHEDAAILKCDACGKVMIDNATSSRPDRYRKKYVPDQSVFAVGNGARVK